MIDPQELILAQSYEALGINPAFQNLMQWLKEDVDALERDVADAPATESNKVLRTKFIMWQQRKQVLSSIEGKINDARIYAKEAAEELDIERRIESDRSTRTEW